MHGYKRRGRRLRNARHKFSAETSLLQSHGGARSFLPRWQSSTQPRGQVEWEEEFVQDRAITSADITVPVELPRGSRQLLPKELPV